MIGKLTLRNLIGAGVRTWLNVIVLSIAFVAIIWTQGFVNGMSRQIMDALIDAEYGGGQYWHARYDRYDPLTVDDAHAPLPGPLQALVGRGDATPLLMHSASIFPGGRMLNVLLKGIDPAQQIVNLPAHLLDAGELGDPSEIPALIGSRMAEQSGLKQGDLVTVRWRDVHGTFDAADARIVAIMQTSVPSVDTGQLWVALERLREMLQADSEATLLILRKGMEDVPPVEAGAAWRYHSTDDLLTDLTTMVKAKTASSSILYTLLLAMGLLAIFDTQVLSIFRRRREIGTLIALGMTRWQVVRLFTMEGALHGILALLIGAVYGIPLLVYTAAHGIGIGDIGEQMGYAIPETLYPTYGAGLVLVTTLIVLVTVTFVSFLPSRRIAKLNPVLALKGKTP